MKPAVHDYADKLLDFAYGELEPAQLKEMESHLLGCARCADELASIRGVRRTMAQLPAEAAPDAGLESLLAYGEQAARRAQAGPSPSPGGWRKWLAPVLGLTAIAALALVTLPLYGQKAASPAAMSAQLKIEEAKAELAVAPAAAVEEQAADELERSAELAQPRREQLAAKADDRDGERQKLAATPPAVNSAYRDDRVAGNSNFAGEGRAGEEGDLGGGGALGKGSSASLGGLGSGRGASVGPSSLPKTGGGSFGSGGYLPPPAEAADEELEASERRRAEAPPEPAKKAKAMESAQELAFKDEAPAGSAAWGGSTYDQRMSSPRTAAKAEAQRESAGLEEDAPSRPSAAPAPQYEKIAAEPEAKESYFAKKQRSASKSRGEDASYAELVSLAAQAREAYGRGDRTRQAELLRQAASLQVSGRPPELAGVLNNLCEVELFLGNVAAGHAACQRVLREYPNSGAAQMANRQLLQQQRKGSADAPGQSSPADLKRSAPTRDSVEVSH